MGYTFEIDGDGDLHCVDDDGDGFYLFKCDFPQIAALIAPTPAKPTIKPTADRVEFYLDDDYLKWRRGYDNAVIFMADDDDTDDIPEGAPAPNTYRTMAAWLIEHQPAVDVATVEMWGRYRNASLPVHTFIQSCIAAANRVRFTLGGGADGDELQWHRGGKSGLVFYARGAEDRAGDVLPDSPYFYGDLAAYIVKHQPTVTADQVKAWGTCHDAAEAALAFLKAQDEPQPAAKDSPWYMDGEYLKHRKQTAGIYIIDTDICDDHDATAAWFVATQPEVSGADFAYLTDGKVASVDCLRRLREIRARLESAVKPVKPASDAKVDQANTPIDVAPAPETPVQRNVVITITFDPANAAQAENIYHAINNLYPEHRRACVKISID